MLEKIGSKKVFIGLFTFFLLLGTLTIFSVELPKRTFQIGMDAFKYVKLDQGVHYFEDQAGYQLTAQRQGLNTRITSYYDSVLISYKNRTLFQEVSYEENEPYHLYLENALIFKSDLRHVNYNKNAFELKLINDEGLYSEEVVYYRNLVHHVMSRVDYLNQKVMFNKFTMLVFTSALGLLCLIFPKKLWILQHYLSVRKEEPTLFFLITTRIMGLIFFLLGINGILL